MAHVPEPVQSLARDLKQIFATRLRSLIAYGLGERDASQASHHAGHGRAAPIHTMAIVADLTAGDLRACAGRAGAWHDAGLATPLVLGAREFERSLDVFPLEFGGILADHVVISGEPPFGALSVKRDDLRRACEVQARSHLLHLREGYIETRGRADALSVLIVRSAAPLAALLRTLAQLHGAPAADPAAAARHAERAIALESGILSEVVELAGANEISSDDATRLFPPYLDATTRLVDYVDSWTQR